MAQIPMECDESKETTVALVSHDCRTRVGQPALLRKTEACSILQRFNLFARRLQRAVGHTWHDCPLLQRAACRAMPRLGASLRGV